MNQHSMSATDLALAAGGPLALGAILGMQRGTLTIATDSLTLPVLLLGVTAVMIPALYIATSMTGMAPPARRVGAAVVRSFRACGVVLLGLAGPVAFLLATTQSRDIVALLGGAAIAVGVLAGLRALFSDLYDDVKDALLIRVVFAGWSLVSLAIGARMYGQFMT